MWSFLVLGIIPGTDIQINFKMWLLALAAALLCFMLLRGAMRKLRSANPFSHSISSEN